MKKWRWLAKMKNLFMPNRGQSREALLQIDEDDYYQIF